MARTSWLDTAEPADPVPPINTSRPEIARIYDYWLGGTTNFAADREAAEAALEAYPGLREGVRAQRAFLRRAVRYLAVEAGIRQFLDIGTGIPAADNTHEIAQAAAPDARIVYVDNNPIVLAHARALLRGVPGQTAYLDADLRDTATILQQAGQLLDFRKPVAVLLIGILQLIPDADDPADIVRRLMEAVPPGSWLAIVQPTKDVVSGPMTKVERRMNNRATTPTTMRSHGQILRFFDGTELLTPPGLIQVHRWRPDEPASEDLAIDVPAYGGIAIKP